MKITYYIALLPVLLSSYACKHVDQGKTDQLNHDMVCECYTQKGSAIDMDTRFSQCVDSYTQQLQDDISGKDLDEMKEILTAKTLEVMTSLVKDCPEYQSDFIQNVDVYSNELSKTNFLRQFPLDSLLNYEHKTGYDKVLALVNLSDYYYYNGEFEKADEIMEQALVLAPNEIFPNMMKLIRLIHENQIDEGIQQCDYIQTIDPNSNNEYATLIKAYFQSKQ